MSDTTMMPAKGLRLMAALKPIKDQITILENSVSGFATETASLKAVDQGILNRLSNLEKRKPQTKTAISGSNGEIIWTFDTPFTSLGSIRANCIPVLAQDGIKVDSNYVVLPTLTQVRFKVFKSVGLTVLNATVLGVAQPVGGIVCYLDADGV